jgi:hypothetical protein
MPTDQPKRSVWPTIVAGVVLALVLIAGYVGSYYAMMTPKTHKFHNMIGASKLVTVPRYGQSDADEGGIAARVFAPIHRLDRRVRPRIWQGPIPTQEEWDAFHRQGFPRSTLLREPWKP